MAEEASSPKRLKQDVDACRGKPEQVIAWLRSLGTVIDGVELREDGAGGHCVFATRELPADSAIASIPASAVLTAEIALASPLGQAARAAGSSADLALWIYMAVGRDDPSHRFHQYLSALPAVSPDPTMWPEDALIALEGTPLLQMVAEAQKAVDAELTELRQKISLPDGVTALPTLEDVLWARGMVLSRSFPAKLVSCQNVSLRPDGQGAVATSMSKDSVAESSRSKSPDGGDVSGVGCMLPFFDLLNHKSKHLIVWEGANNAVQFRAVDAVPAGSEIFNNYGAGRTTEHMLFYYGFAETDAELRCDTVSGTVLHCDFDEDDPESLTAAKAKYDRLQALSIPCELEGEKKSTLRLGPFELRPGVAGSASENDAKKVLPPALLKALWMLGDDEDVGHDVTPVPAPELLELLKGSLMSNLMAAKRAPPPPEEPAWRAASISAYRDGRCRILMDAIFEVEDLVALARGEDTAEDATPA